jgi:hypothetical protein
MNCTKFLGFLDEAGAVLSLCNGLVPFGGDPDDSLARVGAEVAVLHEEQTELCAALQDLVNWFAVSARVAALRRRTLATQHTLALFLQWAQDGAIVVLDVHALPILGIPLGPRRG